jgi:hypothetical protein
MNQIKNSTKNRLFHNEEISENIRRKHACERLIVLETEFIDKIGSVEYNTEDGNPAKITGIKSLVELLAVHKEAWKQGFRNENLGHCKWFRADDITTMQPYEVFLGGINELNTKSLPLWEGEKFDVKPNNGITPYQIVLGQYKDILTSNIKAIADNAKKELDELMALGY